MNLWIVCKEAFHTTQDVLVHVPVIGCIVDLGD